MPSWQCLHLYAIVFQIVEFQLNGEVFESTFYTGEYPDHSPELLPHCFACADKGNRTAVGKRGRFWTNIASQLNGHITTGELFILHDSEHCE